MNKTHLIAVGLGASTLLLAGCGSNAPATSTPPASVAGSPSASANASTGAQGQGGQQGPNSAAFAKFQSCLQQHGVTSLQGAFGFRRDQLGTPPNASPSARPTQDAKTQAAFAACRSLLPQGGFRSGGRRLTNTPQFAAFKTCMSDHGAAITLPSASTAAAPQPMPSAGSARRGFFGLDLTNAKTKAAYDTCKVLLPNDGNFGNRGGAPSKSLAPTPSASA